MNNKERADRLLFLSGFTFSLVILEALGAVWWWGIKDMSHHIAVAHFFTIAILVVVTWALTLASLGNKND